MASSCTVPGYSEGSAGGGGSLGLTIGIPSDMRTIISSASSSSASSLSGNGGGAGKGRLSACRASFIHPNLKCAAATTATRKFTQQTVTTKTTKTKATTTPPRRQNSFDSLNYCSSNSSSSANSDEGDDGCDWINSIVLEHRRSFIGSSGREFSRIVPDRQQTEDEDCDTTDREMAHIRPLACDDDEDDDNVDEDDETGTHRHHRPTPPPHQTDETDGKDETTVSASTQRELDWFKLAGLDSLVAKMLDRNNSRKYGGEKAEEEDVDLQTTTLTKSQSDTVRRRLASLQTAMSNRSTSTAATLSQLPLPLEGLSRRTTLTDKDFTQHVPEQSQSYSGSSFSNTRRPLWRDVRDVFGVAARRSSSSSESHDGDHDIDSSNISSRSDFLSSLDSVDAPSSSTAFNHHHKPAQKSLSIESSPENPRAFPYRQAYCLTQPLETPTKPSNPPRRWRAPLGGQAAADVVGHDAETGVRILKINYRSGYDTVVEHEPPLPVPVWPKAPGDSRHEPVEDIELEFAYRAHPAGSSHPDWPNVVTRTTPGGICHIEDLLWEGDETSVKQLALIELTRIFDDHQLGMQKRRTKPKKKIKNSPDIGIFGSSLDRLMVLDNNRRGSDNLMVGDVRLASHVPIVFQQMLNYLEECGGIQEEGILRICGETNRMRRLRADLDSFYSNPVAAAMSIPTEDRATGLDETQWFRRIFQTVSVHDIASVMKQFLRDLPQPLLTGDLVDAFSQVSDISDRLTQIQALNLLVLQLPLAERATLKALLRTLRKMVDGEKSNKMSSANIAMIIAPNLFHPKGVPPPSPPQPHGFFSSNISLSSSGSSGRNNANNGSDLDPAKQFGIVAKLSEITRIMIVYSHLLFTVPPSFVRQIRQTHTTRTVSAALNGGNKTKERKIRRLDPRRIKVKAQQNLPALPESDKSESTFFQQQFPQDQVVVIRVRLRRRYSNDDMDHHHKVSTAVQVTPGLTAGDVVAKFLSSTTANSSLTSSPEVSASTDKLNLSTSSGVSGSDKSSSSSNEDLLNIDGHGVGGRRQSDSPRRETEPPVTLQTHFLVEQGGNIGMRRLEHNVSMSAAHQLNPKATWIVRYFPEL